MTQVTNDNLRDRAIKIEQIVCDKYCDPETDAADVALDELHQNSNRTNDEIAYTVAMRIVCP